MVRCCQRFMTTGESPCVANQTVACYSAANALVASELNHYINRKRQGKNGILGFKIDISKAYDRLE